MGASATRAGLGVFSDKEGLCKERVRRASARRIVGRSMRAMRMKRLLQSGADRAERRSKTGRVKGRCKQSKQ
jgi:hypothetical protein